MATFRKRNGKWQVQVRRKGFSPITKSFASKADAQEWARHIEGQADRQELGPDRRELKAITLSDLVTRYLKEVVPQKKSREIESILLTRFLRHPICRKALSDLSTSDFAAYRDQRLREVPSGRSKPITAKSLKRELSPLKAARDFLELLDPEATCFTFQTFGDRDRSDKELVRQFHGSLDGHADELQDLNSRGAGIFVTISATDGKGRKAENITHVRAIWQEDDNGGEHDFPLAPSIVVESSPGKFHRYWLLTDKADVSSEFGQLFPGVMETMVRQYGSDPNAKDLPRVLRLPGFLHQKGEAHLVGLIGGDRQRYSTDEILSAFPPIEIAEPTNRDFPTSKDTWDTQTAGRVKSALAVLPAESRDDWFRYGGAIYDASGGSEDAFDIWDEWSKTTSAGNYSQKSQARHWMFEFRRRASKRTTLGTIFYDAIQNGWDESATLREVIIPNAAEIEPGRLTSETMEDLQESFSRYDHHPSPAQMNGLKDLVSLLEAMANGTADKLFHLTSLDPGVGKTQSISHFTKRLLKSEAHKGVSVLVCLGRLAEIKSLVEDMGLKKRDFGVLVADIDGNRDLLLMGNPERLHFAHWGGEDYRATNRFKDVRNVILAGTLFYEHGYYDALGRLSRGMNSDERLGKEARKDIEHGEHAQTILQALCRGSVRKSIGNKCGQCDAYIIANPNSGIPKMLEDGVIFPNAKVVDWSPVERKLTGKVKEAVDFATDYLSRDPKAKPPASTIMAELGMNRQDWHNDVVKHKDFEGALASLGIAFVRGKGRKGSYFENRI